MKVILVFSVLVFICTILYLFLGESVSKKWKLKKGIALVFSFFSLLTSLYGGGIIKISAQINRESSDESNTTEGNNSGINNFNGDIINSEDSELILGDGNTIIEYIYNYENLDNASKLIQAHFYYLEEEYERALAIYKSHELKNNKIANVNLGYMYINGIGVEKNVDIALEYFDRSNSIEGKRNAVYACLVSHRADEMFKRIEELLQENDDVIKNYLCLCKFGMTYEELKNDSNINLSKLDFKIEELHHWHDEGLVKLYSTPTPTDTVRYIAVTSGVDSDPDKGAYQNYGIYRINKIYYTELLNNYIEVA